MTARLSELLNFLSESPNDPFLKYAITMEYQKMGEDEKVREGFEELVKLHADYVGTYYHYAKFLDMKGQREEALAMYQKGMDVAQRVKNRHAYGELLAAYNLAVGIDDEDWD
ncbi:tetratricopeptide repeat protein [Sphingobacterium sp. UT-1RO-CII-1]|uniref:tetratricopeptide repeat protein n=1 Tax=Sphingobacterium sp. UT-1RO-CII-1 TaxID=2995225 RepID=UPI00227A2111|nr:tetratricopeptide repeat protein [Sphingobacterium sp. UT-1RO-CII-1]MCY4780101.1 tetratricopeptide repeat protein [Sphingobacterium sp. UT-1RO-CII-1]